MHLKVSSAKRRPFCPGGDELNLPIERISIPLCMQYRAILDSAISAAYTIVLLVSYRNSYCSSFVFAQLLVIILFNSHEYHCPSMALIYGAIWFHFRCFAPTFSRIFMVAINVGTVPIICTSVRFRKHGSAALREYVIWTEISWIMKWEILQQLQLTISGYMFTALQWRHNGRNNVSNHQPHDCLLNRLFRRRSKKTPMFRVTGFCAGNSPVTGEFPAQMVSNVEMFPFDYVIVDDCLCKEIIGSKICSVTNHIKSYILLYLDIQRFARCIASGLV